MAMIHYANVDEYIAAQSEQAQPLLHLMRKTIREAVPEAQEVISYGMPAYKLSGMLLYFAAQKKHIGYYPMASVLVVFKDELKEYKQGKGSIQFPVDKPLPLELVTKIAKFRAQENLEKAALKKVNNQKKR